MRVKLIGIVVKEKSPRAKEAADSLISYLEKKSIEFIVIPSKKGNIGGTVQRKIPDCDLGITFGGDGTLLFAARVFSPYEIPIVGINLGGLGFITEFRESEVTECVECFLHEEFTLEKRVMIDVQILRDNTEVFQSTGLNDLVVSTGGISRLIELGVSSGHKFIGSYRADGIIVATPTGSTAYSLAAGGPILEPTMEAFVITPICPHSLGARPLVVPSNKEVKVNILSDHREIVGTVDGQIAVQLRYNDKIYIRQSQVVTTLISLNKRSFYDIVSAKLSWKG
jgi:NAD+ kinase